MAVLDEVESSLLSAVGTALKSRDAIWTTTNAHTPATGRSHVLLVGRGQSLKSCSPQTSSDTPIPFYIKLCLLSQCLKAIGVRLEEILIDDALCNDDFEVQNLDEQRQRLLMEEDENEDFLVEGCFCFVILLLMLYEFVARGNEIVMMALNNSILSCSECQSVRSGFPLGSPPCRLYVIIRDHGLPSRLLPPPATLKSRFCPIERQRG